MYSIANTKILASGSPSSCRRTLFVHVYIRITYAYNLFVHVYNTSASEAYTIVEGRLGSHRFAKVSGC